MCFPRRQGRGHQHRRVPAAGLLPPALLLRGLRAGHLAQRLRLAGLPDPGHGAALCPAGRHQVRLGAPVAVHLGPGGLEAQGEHRPSACRYRKELAQEPPEVRRRNTTAKGLFPLRERGLLHYVISLQYFDIVQKVSLQ